MVRKTLTKPEVLKSVIQYEKSGILKFEAAFFQVNTFCLWLHKHPEPIYMDSNESNLM